MQIKCPHRKFYRLDAIRDELSPQAAERFDQLRREGGRLLPSRSRSTTGA